MVEDPRQAQAGDRTEAGDTPPDHRKGRRRRGEALYRAIFEATLDELAEVGYAELTMERVAARARTGKTSVYRRWPSRAELVVDAIAHALPARDELSDTGDLREDVLTLLRRVVERLAGPLGEAARGLIAEAVRDPDLASMAQNRVIDSPAGLMLEILRRGAVRGEVRPQALTPWVATVGPTLVREHFLIHGTPIPDQVLTEIVDQVVLPLTRPDHS